MAKVRKISISLPKDMVDDIRYAVDSGRYATVSEVVREAVREWKGHEGPFPPNYPIARTKEELVRMIKEGIASADRGDVIPAEEVYARLEAKLAAMKAAKKRGKHRR